MGLLGKIFSSTFGSAVEQIGGTIKKFVTTDKDRMEMQMQLEKILQERDSEIEQTIQAELQAKEKVMVAELQQGDNYTKRARPTVVYAGLGFIFFNYCLIPVISRFLGTADVGPLELPTAFWAGWSGIVATWSIGRSAEKRGTRNKVTDFVTGGKFSGLMGK